jgi:cytochrome c-type biogenesis protein
MNPLSGVTIPAAVAAGIISFLSPCVLPLVPGYIAAVAGVRDLNEIRPRNVIGPILAFIGSFSAIFIALGLLGQRAIHAAFRGQTALHICGWVIVLMGVLFLASQLVPRLARTYHLPGLMESARRGGPVLVGAAFALCWTPCIGPTLGAIITATGTSSGAAQGAILMAFYCLGLGIPFAVAGLAFGTFTSALGVVRRFYPVIIVTGGLVLIAMGVLILSGDLTQLNTAVSNGFRTLHVPNLAMNS